MIDYHIARRKMVEEQLVAQGIRDKRVLNAMDEVPRHEFVPKALVPQAYNDHPLNIGRYQTISQPIIVARMTEALELKGDERVLEIGTGSGYQAAILCCLVKQLYSIERISSLALAARQTLFRLHYLNLSLRIGDGSLGWPEEAPFDAIMVTAASPQIPQALKDQLKVGGKLVIPTGEAETQDLLRLTKTKKGFEEQSLGGCRFVKLVGAQGFSAEEDR